MIVAAANHVLAEMTSIRANLRKANEAARQHLEALNAMKKLVGKKRKRPTYDPKYHGLPPWVYASLSKITNASQYSGTGSSPATAPTDEGGD